MLLLFFLSPPRDRLQRHRFAFQMPHFNKGNAALQQGKRLAFASKSPQVSEEKPAGFRRKARRFQWKSPQVWRDKRQCDE